MSQPLPANEAKRIEILKGYGVLDSAPDSGLDDLTALAGEICGTPIALISLVDECRQWFKSKTGTELKETPREHSFCAHVIEGDSLFVVADARDDPRFAENPLVTGDPHIRFYAGAPLITPEGVALGSLCVIDRQKRELTAAQLRSLTILSREVMTHLELKRKIHELEASEARYRSVFERNPHPMFVHDPETLRFLAVNNAAVSRYGYSRAEFLEMGIEDIRAKDGSGPDRAGMWRHKTRGGGLIDVEITSHTLDFDGRKAEIVLVHDITERKRTESEIHRSTDLLRAITGSTTDAIFVKDIEGRYLFFNEAASDLTGKPAEEIIGRDDHSLFEGDGAQVAMENDQLVMRTNQVQTREEVLTSSGVTRTYLATKAPYRDGAGNVIGIIGISRDITDRKNLERQFLRSQRLESIGTLAGGIAHDLNNVLSPIMMAIDLLRSHVNDPDAADILNVIARSARRGAEMVGQVLTFARGMEGKSEEINASDVISDLVRIIEDTFPKNIRIESRQEPSLWSIKGDPTQIHQVLLNLCVNARDAMKDGGVITLHAENLLIDEHDAGMDIDARPGPYLRVEVADTGHGIPAETIDKVFDPFFTTKNVGEGTGLGLSSSLAIIKGHGGFIRVNSGPGKGARFVIHLPALTGGGPMAASHQRAVLPQGNGETVMVVDDEESIRHITGRTLESFGYKVLLASDGSEAVSMYARHQSSIRVVLTDMMMPVMDGPSTIHVLRRLNPSLRIIGASGINTENHVAKAAGAGVDHFLAKPYTAETLLQAIRKVMEP